MYEPIRAPSVHTMAVPATPHRSRDEELEFQLASQLAGLLTVTDELRALEPCAELDQATEQLAEGVTRLQRGRPPVRLTLPAATPGQVRDAARIRALHRRARALAGRALVVAESRQDQESAALAARQMALHQASA